MEHKKQTEQLDRLKETYKYIAKKSKLKPRLERAYVPGYNL